jgi:alkaline phosphatase D
MRRIVRRGAVTAESELGHAVHALATGLRPDRWHWYRFTCGAWQSMTGRTRTMPLPGAPASRLRFAFASCQHYEHGYFTAYDHLAAEAPDLVVHLGDYIYEAYGVPGRPRLHRDSSVEIRTLDQYRARYALYKLDQQLQRAHSCAPWIVTSDDHEVKDNYAAGIPELPDPDFMQRRVAAYQAYYENMPLRRAARPVGPDMRLYRRLSFGKLATFHVLDTRQYRTDQPGHGRVTLTDAMLEPGVTILGRQQREWLFNGLDRSRAHWNVLAQQVMMTKVDLDPGPDFVFSADMWPAYEYERRKVISHLTHGTARNPVVITGDYHSNFANEIINDFEGTAPRHVAVEFVGTSISSNGDGMQDPPNKADVMAANPFVKFRNHERGYVSCEITPDTYTAHFRTVPYVSKPGAPLNTRASFVVENGKHRLLPA